MPQMKLTGAACALVLLYAAPAAAQTEEVAPEALRKAAMTETATTIPDGWRVTAQVGGSINITDARNVVGAIDGTAIQIGANINIEGKYKSGQHTWDNVLTIREALARTPNANEDIDPAFVKSLDQLDLLSTYIYRFSDPSWLGPFAQLKLNTQIFDTVIRAQQDFTVRRQSGGGAAVEATGEAGDTIDTTGAFEPLLLREVVGLFGQPFAEPVFTLDLKVGVAAQQIIARGGFNLIGTETDGDGNPIFTLQEIEDTFDLGAELSAGAKGYLIKDVVTWNASVTWFLPAVTSGDVFSADNFDADGNPEKLDTLDRQNLEILGGIGIKLTKYISFDYNLLVRRFPQVRDAFQVQNGFQLTLTMDLI